MNNTNKLHAAHFMLKHLDSYVGKPIMDVLAEAGEDGLCVTALIRKVNRTCGQKRPQASISCSLIKFRKYKLVATRREGKKIYYSLDTDRIARITTALKSFK